MAYILYMLQIPTQKSMHSVISRRRLYWQKSACVDHQMPNSISRAWCNCSAALLFENLGTHLWIFPHSFVPMEYKQRYSDVRGWL